ncbi:MAG: class II fumarate hydratase [Patescibacteria group bacterium]
MKIKSKVKIEKDSLGNVQVPENKYWGAQTQRALNNFKIGKQKMPIEIIRALAIVKKAAALSNNQFGILSSDKCELICKVCDEILNDKLDEHFPLFVWQSGSGTQTNMNINEVVTNRAKVLNQKITLHPNDDVNRSQSSNDVFPSAMHIAAYKTLIEKTIPNIEILTNTFDKKSQEFKNLIKIGRTHLTDAVPLSLGQEFSGYAFQLKKVLNNLKYISKDLLELPLGGTAVGTGLNAPKTFDKLAVQNVSKLTGYSFIVVPNKFALLSSHDVIVEISGILKTLATILIKIASDIRLYASGPKCGIGELLLPDNEPGSSIMPGKVNPTQCEMLIMVCSQIIGNDVTITLGNMNGNFQLNTSKPLIIYNFLESAQLLADSCKSFNDNCAIGIKANISVIKNNLDKSLSLVTALNPYIGYDKAAKIARNAFKKNITLKKSAVELGLVKKEDFDKWISSLF